MNFAPGAQALSILFSNSDVNSTISDEGIIEPFSGSQLVLI